MQRSLFATAALAALLIAAPAFADTVPIKATLNNASEVPPTKGKGAGTMTGSVDTTSGLLVYTVTYKGLTGPATMAHFHGPALPGANAPVVVALPELKSPITDSATLTPTQVADLIAGKYYVNVHTPQNKGGEIRGQVEVAK
jgi:hypothetical protein